MAYNDRFHEAMMRLAISIARPGQTFPNPAVGCVITRDQNIIAYGATSGLGGSRHAEEIALEMAGSRAQGSHVFITLEPCARRSQGGCGCAVRLKDQGVKAVYYACHDPSQFADHQGPALLHQANIDVKSGLLETEAAGLIKAWSHFLKFGRPLITLWPHHRSPLGMDAPFDPLAQNIEIALSKHLELGHRHLWINEDHILSEALGQKGWLDSYTIT